MRFIQEQQSVDQIERLLKVEEHQTQVLEFLCTALNTHENISDADFDKALKLKEIRKEFKKFYKLRKIGVTDGVFD